MANDKKDAIAKRRELARKAQRTFREAGGKPSVVNLTTRTGAKPSKQTRVEASEASGNDRNTKNIEKSPAGIETSLNKEYSTTMVDEPAQKTGSPAQKIGTEEKSLEIPKNKGGRPRKSELQKKADREARIKAAAEAKKAGDPIVFGFCEIPPEWPKLPANSSLASDIQWVQSNRLRVCEETPEGTKVDLSKSISPAPSWSAIGWLETSIRSYSKYCEITARATQSVEDGNAAVRRERTTLDHLRTILSDMAAV